MIKFVSEEKTRQKIKASDFLEGRKRTQKGEWANQSKGLCKRTKKNMK